jgi:HD-GYP domain-containing protein (c-di-GMP phosphodiesterase class II)
LPDDEVESVSIGGILHDIGKIGFSDKLFGNEDKKPSKELLDEIRKHPEIGVQILKDREVLGPVLDYGRYHHERLDGQGYPCGIQGDSIPLGAKIISVADCFDAMTTARPYQKGMSGPEAFAILRKLSGASLSPDLVELFIREIEENGLITDMGE